jgi:phosphoglycolate phosphatase
MKHLAPLLKTKEAIVFDLDGTLMHTEPEVKLAINRALADCDCPQLPPETRLPNMYGTIPHILESALALIGVPASRIPEIHAVYTKHYNQQAHANTALYPGVRTLLEELRGHHFKLGVCTNKNEAAALHALRTAGIFDFFSAVTGANTTLFPKPHPLPLTHTLKGLGVAAQNAVLIGDTHVDAECAAQCNVDFILHQGGYGAPAGTKYKIAGQFMTYERAFS